MNSNATPITNIRNLSSNWWQKVNSTYSLEPKYRCSIPFIHFAEPPHYRTCPSAVNQNALFAGIWRPWHEERLMQIDKKNRRGHVEGDFELFAFLSTEAKKIVRPVHEKAMPVILTEPQDWKQ